MRWRSRKGAHGSSLATSLATAGDHLGATHGLGAGRVHGVAVPVHLWAGSVLGAARGPGPLGRRSQAGKGARWCRVRGDLPAWRVTSPLHPVRRSQGRLAARGPGRRRRGMGRRGRCSGNAWRCLPAGAHCTRSAGTPGAPHFLGLPPRSRFWVSARGIPRGGVSACGGGVFLYHFFRGGLDDEPAVLRNTGDASVRSVGKRRAFSCARKPGPQR